MSRNTVRRQLKSPEATRPRPRPPRGSKLDPYAEHIDWRMGEGLENCRVLDQEVRSLGYQGNSSEPPPWPASKSRQLSRPAGGLRSPLGIRADRIATPFVLAGWTDAQAGIAPVLC